MTRPEKFLRIGFTRGCDANEPKGILVVTFRFCEAATAAAMAISLLAGCASEAPAVDKARLASVHTILFEGITEPPDRPFWEQAGGPPRSLLGRAHVAEDARNAIGATLIREGYRIVPNAKSADAVLSINIEVADYGPNQPFHRDCMPSMLIAVNLKDTVGKPILKREYFYADISSVPGISGWLLLREDPKYTSPDCSGYSPELTMAAFHDVVPLLAQAVGAELSPTSPQ